MKDVPDPVFEIKIALLGLVSVGKTTVLNALFRDKYGEVSMKKATAGANYFQISMCTPSKQSAKDDDQKWSAMASEPIPRNSESILQEITNDNKLLRSSLEIQEKYFLIELESAICPMRHDTTLIFIDLPGVDEADAGTKYKDYVKKTWKSFDCAIVVIDGRNGVNTQEQVDLLKSVKKYCSNLKDIPVIILCNKIDDPQEEEMAEMVKEVQEEVERIFQVTDRRRALYNLLNSSMNLKDLLLYPAFVTTSASSAFIYQTAPALSMEHFKKFYKDHAHQFERIGLEELGRKWKSLKQEDKIEEVYKILGDPVLNSERLSQTNFDTFLKTISRTIGGEDAQAEIICRQINVARGCLSAAQCIADQIALMDAKYKAIGLSVAGQLKEDFWKTYRTCETQAFEELLPQDVHRLSRPMGELLRYHKFIAQVGWITETRVIEASMRALICRQIATVFNEERHKRCKSWTLEDEGREKEVSWTNISPGDWKTICRSILFVSHERNFYQDFGQEKLLLEGLVDDINSMSFGSDAYDYNHYRYRGSWKQNAVGGYKFKNGKLLPIDKKLHRKIFKIQVPESLSDSNHWGHLAWRYCQFKAEGK